MIARRHFRQERPGGLWLPDRRIIRPQASRFGVGFVTAPTPPSVSFADLAHDASNSATYTFTDAAIGTADASRLVVVFGWIVSAVTIPALSTMTIGGSAATSVVERRSTQAHAFMYQRAIAAGTTATVVIGNGSGSNLRCGIAVYSIYNLVNPTAAGTNSTSTDAGSLALTTVPGSIVLAGLGTNDNTTCTWTGVTEQHDSLIEGTACFTSGMAVATVSESRAINGNVGSAASGFYRAVSAVWR